MKKYEESKDKFIIENFSKYSIKELALKLNVCKVTIWNRAKKLNLINKNHRKAPVKYHNYKEDIIQQIKDFGYNPISVKNKKWIEVQCPICLSGSFNTTFHRLKTHHTKSCGCIKGKDKRQGTKNISKTFFTRLVDGANSRNIEVSITIEDLENLILKQNFKCAYSGLDIIIGYLPIGQITASVDRIDSKRGYDINNICFVHKDINRMKQHYSLEYFINICKAVSSYEYKP